MTCKLYLAGPYGFSEAGRYFYYQVFIPRIEALGCEVLNPWTLTATERIARVQGIPYGSEKRSAWQRLNAEIAANNVRAIDRADGIIIKFLINFIFYFSITLKPHCILDHKSAHNQF